MVCPRCATVNPPEARFCIACGAPLQSGQMQPTESTSQPTTMPPAIGGAAVPVPPASQPSRPLGAQTDEVPAAYGAVPSQPQPTGPYPTYPPGVAQPVPPPYPVPPYPGTFPPPGYVAPPSQPLYPGYGASPSQPLQGYGYAAPPSQPYYPMAGVPQPLYGQPAAMSTPLASGGASAVDGIAGIFGPDADPSRVTPQTRVQAVLVRNLGARTAVNKWFMAGLGSAVAVIVGVILSAIGSSVFSNIVGGLLQNATNGSAASALNLDAYKQYLTPDVLKLFELSHGVPLNLHVSVTGSVAQAAGDVTLRLPVTGLLLIPALGLTLGGYVSAASDYSRRAVYSLARGALVAPIYALLLTLLALIGTSSTSLGALGTNAAISVGPSPVQAFLFGLLWGAVFGALGGWLQLYGRRVLAAALPTLQGSARPRLTGAIAGAATGFVTAVVIYIPIVLALLCVLEINIASTPSFSGPGQLDSVVGLTGLGNIGGIIFFALVLGPAVGSYAFALGAGASVTTEQAATSLTGASTNQGTSIGMFGAQQAIPSTTFWILAIVPVLCYLIGGRVAARVAKASDPASGFLIGASTAMPWSILAAIAAYLAGLNLDAGALGANAGVTVTPSVAGTFIATLIGAAVVGGIGGATTLPMPWLGDAPRLLALPFRPIGLALFPLLDRLTARPQHSRTSASRAWLYDGVLCAFCLTILALVLRIGGVSFITFGIPYKVLSLIYQIVGGLLIGLPLMYFLGALVVAFSSPAALLPLEGTAPRPSTTMPPQTAPPNGVDMTVPQ